MMPRGSMARDARWQHASSPEPPVPLPPPHLRQTDRQEAGEEYVQDLNHMQLRILREASAGHVQLLGGRTQHSTT